MWIALAVVGWAVGVGFAYVLIRHENATAIIDKPVDPNAIAPAAGPAQPGER